MRAAKKAIRKKRKPPPFVAPWRVRQISRNVLDVHLDFSKRKEYWFLMISDAHTDNAHCDIAMQRRHLEQMVERDGAWLSNGDLFCAMQGKWDRRRDQEALLPELRGNDYLDRLVQYHADYYEKYAERCLLLGDGNHETAILSHHETDLTQRLVATFKERTGSKVVSHGYAGWVVFRCSRGRSQGSIRLYRHHGSGGSSPVTKGVIAANRIGTWCPDANIVLLGHNHNEWIFPVARARINKAGRTYSDEQLFVRVPGYKDEWGDGAAGWSVEKCFGPHPRGAMWLRVFSTWTKDGDCTFSYEVTRAK